MTSSSNEVARILQRLETSPEDREAWFQLGLWCQESGLRPPGEAALRLLPRLAEIWSKNSRDRVYLPAFLGLVDAQLPADRGSLSLFWDRSHRQRGYGPSAYDDFTGFPLMIVRRRDGARMHLLPWTMLAPGRDASGTRWPVPRKKRSVSSFYLDEVPVNEEQFARVMGLPVAPRQLASPLVSEPALVEAFQALAYVARLGAELPTELEWCRSRTRSEILDGAPTFATPHLDAEDRREIREKWHAEHDVLLRLESNFGIHYPAGPEWTSTWFPSYLHLLREEGRDPASLKPGSREGSEGLVVRQDGHFSVERLRGPTFAFRVAIPVGEPQPADQPPRYQARPPR